jgi:hypothetical protein
MIFNVKIIIFHLVVSEYKFSKLGNLRILGVRSIGYYGCEALVTAGTSSSTHDS